VPVVLVLGPRPNAATKSVPSLQSFTIRPSIRRVRTSQEGVHLQNRHCTQKYLNLPLTYTSFTKSTKHIDIFGFGNSDGVEYASRWGCIQLSVTVPKSGSICAYYRFRKMKCTSVVDYDIFGYSDGSVDTCLTVDVDILVR
jgi:hypothetical protein